jgi:spoIIIJ-associated protein
MTMNKSSMEFEGSNIDDAVRKALKELKVKRNCVKIETVVEEEKGLFGMPGAKPAKIRVSLIEKK